MIETQGQLFDKPGFKKFGTSEEAAISMEAKVPRLRDRVLTKIKQLDLTADEVAYLLDETPFAIRPRLSELLKMGMIFDTGKRYNNESGRKAIVWGAKHEIKTF